MLIRYISPKERQLFCRIYFRYDSNFNLPLQSSHKGIRMSGQYPGPCGGTPPNGSGWFLFLLQNDAAGHDTLKNADRGGATTLCMIQVPLANCSAKALLPRPAASPTAMHLAAAAQETAWKTVLALPPMARAARTLQLPRVHSAEYGKNRPAALM